MEARQLMQRNVTLTFELEVSMAVGSDAESVEVDRGESPSRAFSTGVQVAVGPGVEVASSLVAGWRSLSESTPQACL